MRILFSESSPNLGGQELQLLQQMQALQKRQIAVQLVCRDQSGIHLTAQRQHLPVVAVPFRNSLHFPSIYRVRQLIKNWRPDVVVSHSGHDANVCGVAAKSLLRRPTMVRVRTYQHDVPHAWSYNWLADLTLVPSQEMRSRILRNPRIDATRIHILYPGLDFKKIAQDARTPLPSKVVDWLALHPGRLIVHAAMLRTEKGHLLMLEVVARLIRQFPDIRYVIAGAGERQSVLTQHVVELGLEEHVFFAGMMQPVAPLLQAAHLVVMPSLIEPLGMAQIEALSLGVPVLGSRVDGIPETISHEETGLLVPPGNVESWVAALHWALEHPSEMSGMAGNGRVRVLNEFSIAANIDRFLQLIQRYPA